MRRSALASPWLALVLIQPAIAAGYTLPPAGARYDSQLGGAYAPPAGTQIVSRDRQAPAAPGLYNICYINAFQTQPQDVTWWLANHPQLVLRRDDIPVEDPNWPGEYLLDTSTAENRAGLLAIVSNWIDDCAKNGFDAIEPDNLDTYSRSGGLLSIDDNLAFARAFIAHAHVLGLAVAQKNSLDLAERGPQAGFDFAITESCQVWDECGAYIESFGDYVLDIEYTDTDRGNFDRVCASYGENISVILRDRNLTTPADTAYVYQAC
ncbi:endo alpha-1,4 polygalactosaminidase [Devosia sp. XK-2]|uniref:endo alpha-1,4 polygalactosaminidase n=1 Tax=Devosia sp. XK-2 TaxID=3126689 RepID=UPI0030D09759